MVEGNAGDGGLHPRRGRGLMVGKGRREGERSRAKSKVGRGFWWVW